MNILHLPQDNLIRIIALLPFPFIVHVISKISKNFLQLARNDILWKIIYQDYFQISLDPNHSNFLGTFKQHYKGRYFFYLEILKKSTRKLDAQSKRTFDKIVSK